ncbi:MAG: hypothetical protein ACU83O_14190 [Gammaproteobacteria bacterium]
MIQTKALERAKIKMISGAATFVVMLIIVTPLCGALFGCGCNWPGLGLDENCNFYHQSDPNPCPWCRSLIAGGLSVGFSIMTGILATLAPLPRAFSRPVNEAALRILLGMLAFLAIAAMSAALSAAWFHLPLSSVFFLR